MAIYPPKLMFPFIKVKTKQYHISFFNSKVKKFPRIQTILNHNKLYFYFKHYVHCCKSEWASYISLFFLSIAFKYLNKKMNI